MSVSIDLDGTGLCDANTGIPFLDHMLDVRGATVRETQRREQQRGLTQLHSSLPFDDCVSASLSSSQQIASHGLFDVVVHATGDTHIDDHHTNEDIGLAFGTALAQALGDRKGIHRFGEFSAPLDEALTHVVLVRHI